MGADKEQAKGKWEEAKGKGKQAYGDVADDPDKSEEGTMEEAKGKGRQAFDKAKDWVEQKTGDDKDRA